MARESRRRLHFDLGSEARQKWLRQQAKAQDVTENEILRNLMDAAMSAGADQLALELGAEPDPEPEPAEDIDPRARFLASVRRWFNLELSAERADLEWDEVATWLRKPRFLEQAQRAQWIYLAEVEQDLLKCGKLGKGNAIATEGFLKAHHPFYGRAKAEEFLRGWGRLQDDLFKCLAEEFGPQQAAGLERALKRFESMKEVRMAART